MFDLTGRTAVVTGASSGLGARFAHALRGQGADVVLGARRRDRIEALADSLGREHADAVQVDVTDPDAVAALVGRAVERFGRLDVMVNNAGVARPRPAEEDTPQAFNDVVSVNLGAVFTGCHEAGKVMLEQGSGSIVNVASVLGMIGSWRIPDASYCASKGGVVNLTRELGAQWARRGVRVNAIAPGWFPSEMTEAMVGTRSFERYVDRLVPAGRMGGEAELDGVLVFLASDASSYVVGQTIAVDGGWSAV
jgi:NAD(P)-dependent dehydrogenase (short-subunit alcohol dehydrogenase family)